jgi:nucleotidyltransferase AbiEii toxin of type IV toxin-antitoxin system
VPGGERDAALPGVAGITTEPRRNLAHSGHDQLLHRARARQEDLNLLLTRYALERLLYRLSRSAYRERFVLKGAMLFQLWTEEPCRPTRDLDLLGYGAPDPEQIAHVFREVCAVDVDPDGLGFDARSVHCTVLKPDADYVGVRVQLTAWLGTAPIRLHIDIGFGDVVTPGPRELDYPSLLGQPAARLRTYPRDGGRREAGGARTARPCQQPPEGLL